MNSSDNSNKASLLWMRIFSFLTVAAILCSLAATGHGRLFGVDIAASGSKDTPDEETVSAAGNQIVINTTEAGKEALGYGGPVPVEIYITAGRIDSIVALPNCETPSFFSRLEKEGLTHVYDGKTLSEALAMTPDAVSGATYSSKAYMANVRTGLEKALADSRMQTSSQADYGFTWSMCIALLVILAGAVLPFFIKGKVYRIVQQILNIYVLGFWTGTFIDYAMMEKFLAGGITASFASLIMAVLFVIGFIYPIFGRTGHYCSWICPYGSLQDIMGLISRKKLTLSPALVKGLEQFRMLLWVVLLSLLWIGWGTQWIENEIFAAFIVESASVAVICFAIAFLLLSILIPRPFCRFVCPTGTILRLELKNEK